MRNFPRPLAALVGLLFSISASAQTYLEPVRITRLAVDDGGNAYVRASTRSPYPGSPACATNQAWDFYFNSSTPAGQGLLAAALTSKNTKASVRLVGTGGCTNNVEALYVLDILEQ